MSKFYPEYNELPKVLTRERTKPLYVALAEGRELHDQQAKRIRELERRLTACAVYATQAIEQFHNENRVRELLRDIASHARRGGR
jgi:hypothetical protein